MSKGIVEEFDAFLDKFTGKHEKDSWIKQTLYPDTVQVRKDLIVKEFRNVLQSQADQYEREKGEMLQQIQKLLREEDPVVVAGWIALMLQAYGVDLSE